MAIFFDRLSTEQPNPRSRGLDRKSALEIVRLMNREDARVVAAVRRAAPAIARAADLFVSTVSAGGRIYFVGAGTSGRLGVLEAAECPPTFNTPRGTIRSVMAGGPAAVFQSQEGAEDCEADGRRALRGAGPKDLVIGIAASGVTPFVRAALEAAGRRGAKTVLLTCNRFSLPPGGGGRGWGGASATDRHPPSCTFPLKGGRNIVDLLILLDVGPEVLSGSTRLKAGTACKMALNMITTAGLVRSGKAYDNWMVDLQPRSRKLIARGLRLIRILGGVSEKEAQELFKAAGGRVKHAILMARKKISRQEAATRLKSAKGFLRKALG